MTELLSAHQEDRRSIAKKRWITLGAAAAVWAMDQANKLSFLYLWQLMPGDRYSVLPFLDIVMVWNRGVSYGLFSTTSASGPYVLAAIKLMIVAGLLVWLWRETRPLSLSVIALLIGGALGNITDRFLHGAVADFYLFHIGSFQWYVFNLADVAIVAGVLLLVYESTQPSPSAAKNEGVRKHDNDT